jgi:S-DNA-T family DNA segregation ATPase FtsK/SpoIIIE
MCGFGFELIDPSLSPMCKLFKVLGVAGITYYAWTYSKFDRLFHNLGLGKGLAYPILKGKTKTDISTIYRFTLPAGLSIKDFDDKKEAIENYIGAEVDMKYTYKEIMIEVYNSNKKTFYEYVPTKVKGEVPIIIGYDIREELISCDLSSGEPHMGIYGESGSGKSTIIRTIITNLILMSDVTLHLVDLKNGAEFNLFRNSSKVASFCRNTKETHDLLMSLSIEVDRRYDLFYEKDVKDIKEYNKKFKLKKMDYQILIVDEFADLDAKSDDMNLLKLLARKSRACGIHILLSTQRPSSKILDGDIKANITSILGLKTINSTNSSIIIDEVGLEKLRGNGHAKFKRGGKLIEVQCPFLDTDPCKELIKHTYVNKQKPKQTKNGQLTDEDIFNAVGW